MKKENLIWALALVWLFGLIEPVFADGDLAGQFPDVVSRSPAGRAVWAAETTPQSPWATGSTSQGSGGGPWTVEMWSRGRRRYKRFNHHNANNNYNPSNSYDSSNSYNPSSSHLSSASYNPSSSYRSSTSYNSSNSYNPSTVYNPSNSYNPSTVYNPSNNYNSRNRDNFYNLSTNYRSRRPVVPIAANYTEGAAGQAQHNAWLVQSQPRAGAGSGQYNNGNDQFNNAGDASGLARKPDKFADNPQIDDSGVRHFGNGRHYDLKTIPMEQALAISQVLDSQIKQEQLMARARRRERARRRNFD